MTNQEKIQIEIEKQINAGFTIQEIRQNLLLQNFTNTEINEGLKRMPVAAKAEKSNGGYGFLSLLLSLFFIIRGVMYLGKSNSDGYHQTMGIIFLLLGVAGFIIKGISMARR